MKYKFEVEPQKDRRLVANDIWLWCYEQFGGPKYHGENDIWDYRVVNNAPTFFFKRREDYVYAMLMCL